MKGCFVNIDKCAKLSAASLRSGTKVKMLKGISKEIGYFFKRKPNLLQANHSRGVTFY